MDSYAIGLIAYIFGLVMGYNCTSIYNVIACVIGYILGMLLCHFLGKSGD